MQSIWILKIGSWLDDSLSRYLKTVFKVYIFYNTFVQYIVNATLWGDICFTGIIMFCEIGKITKHSFSIECKIFFYSVRKFVLRLCLNNDLWLHVQTNELCLSNWPIWNQNASRPQTVWLINHFSLISVFALCVFSNT